MMICATTGIEFPETFFGIDKNNKDGLNHESYIGNLWVNISQRARNGSKHDQYRKHHNDRYTRISSAIGMDPTWINDPQKFAMDILLAFGMPRFRDGFKLSLDRIDNARGYFIDNLRWATALEQAENKGLSKEENRFF